MSPHLPYAYNDDDEFQHPSLGWILLDRALTLDNWLTWRNALPEARHLRNSLPIDVSRRIITLADALHAIHQRFQGYAGTMDSPFVVPRWWDPDDDDWTQGGICLLRIKGICSGDFIGMWKPQGDPVSLFAVSEHFIEARLLREAPLLEAPTSLDCESSTRRNRRRRSPPCRKPPDRAATPEPAGGRSPLSQER